MTVYSDPSLFVKNRLRLSDRLSSRNMSLPVYTEQEVASHCSAESLWLIIEDKVYDVTQFLENVSELLRKRASYCPVADLKLPEPLYLLARLYSFLQHPGGRDVLLDNAGQ